MINSFKKILVPIDGSVYSEKCLERACELAGAFNFVLTFLTAKEQYVGLGRSCQRIPLRKCF